MSLNLSIPKSFEFYYMAVFDKNSAQEYHWNYSTNFQLGIHVHSDVLNWIYMKTKEVEIFVEELI